MKSIIIDSGMIAAQSPAMFANRPEQRVTILLRCAGPILPDPERLPIVWVKIAQSRWV